MNINAGFPIEHVTQYTYLGKTLRPHLQTYSPSSDNTTFIEDVQRRMTQAFSRNFYHDPILHNASPALQNMVFQSAVLGSIVHLITTMPLSDNIERDINATITNHINYMTRSSTTGGNTPGKLAIATFGRLPTAFGFVMRGYERLHLSLINTPFQDDLAPRIYRAISAEQELPLNAITRYVSWTQLRHRLHLRHNNYNNYLYEKKHLWEIVFNIKVTT